MSKQQAPIFPREQRQAQALGQRLRAARLRRRVPLGELAARTGVTRTTLRRLEQGDPSVGLALLIRTMSVLGLANDIDRLAANDEVGQRLAEIGLSERPHRRTGESRP
jgi:transcriptional regulator with XRE-family HTH domain